MAAGSLVTCQPHCSLTKLGVSSLLGSPLTEQRPEVGLCVGGGLKPCPRTMVPVCFLHQGQERGPRGRLDPSQSFSCRRAAGQTLMGGPCPSGDRVLCPWC